uniref:Uncharacterized protein n=1 Tax=Ralstonia solanacearum TaxID=305 RepID=A0A0S4TPC7_RALSL|nr:protein of unknown function [Ralstonia solanacearum]
MPQEDRRAFVSLVPANELLGRDQEVEASLLEDVFSICKARLILCVEGPLLGLHFNNKFPRRADQEEVRHIGAEFSKIQEKRLVGYRRNFQVEQC